MTTDPLHRIFAEIDRRRDEIVDFTADLVRFPSVNRPPDGDELACQQFVETTFNAMGLEVDVFRPDEVPGIETNPGWWSGTDYSDRPNVVGTRRGEGDGQSLLLLAHIDVVPEGPHDLWTYGPFTPTVEGDALVGRGSNDDKGGLAAAVMALACVESAGFRVNGDVILASVVDEESAGANGTLAVLHRPHLADAAVYCDGLDLDIHTANLGGINAEIELQVRPDVAGITIARIMPIATALYEHFEQYAVERRARIAVDPRYADSIWPEFAVRTHLLQVGSEDGGNAGGARFHVSFYVLPGEDLTAIGSEIEAQVRTVTSRYPDLLPPRIEWYGRVMPPSDIPTDHPFVERVANAYREATNTEPILRGSPMSDLFQFLLHSPQPLPTIGMGPGRWDDTGAHHVNESVLIDKHLIPFTKTLAALIVDWCGVEERGG